MSLFKTEFYFNTTLVLLFLFSCKNEDHSVWNEINKTKALHSNEFTIVCGISNNDCILCTGALKEQLLSLCNKYNVVHDSILFVSPELRKVEIDFLFYKNMKLSTIPERRIESNNLYEFLRKDVNAMAGLNFYEIINPDKKVVDNGVFHKINAE